MFKSLIAYRISPLWPADLAAIEEALAKSPFIECGATQQKSAGWVPPRGEAHGALVESIGGQWIARLMTETKSVPGDVLARIAELESELEAVGAGGVSGPLMGIAAPPTAQAEGWTKPHRTITYTCPVCAASLERQE